MNERIKELAKEAGLIQAKDFKSGDEVKNFVFGNGLEKFAELIVRECSAFANHFSDGHEKDQFGRKMFLYTNDIGQVILEHFGVEE
jgi:hypothetical protein